MEDIMEKTYISKLKCKESIWQHDAGPVRIHPEPFVVFMNKYNMS